MRGLTVLLTFSVSLQALATCPTPQEIQERADDAAVCNAEMDQAADCCDNPASCSSAGGGGIGIAVGGDGQLMQLMMTLSVGVLISQSDSSQMRGFSGICNMLNLGNVGSNYNNNVASQCTSLKGQCTRQCRLIAKELDAWHDSIDASCTKEKDEANRIAALADNDLDHCKSLRVNTQVTAQASNFNMAGNNAALKSMCNQLAQRQPEYFPDYQPMAAPTASVDCSNPMMANNPQCLACERDSSGSCLKGATDSANTAAFNEGSSRLGANDFNVASAADGNLAQNPKFESTPPVAQSANRPQGSGGGMNPSSQGGAQQQDARGGGGGGPGRPVYDISDGSSRGTIAGGAGGPDGSEGGFAGYGAGERNVAGIDLKKFLPGGARHARSVAGVGSANPDINTRGTDIFKRVSDRFKVVCSDRLRDCAINHLSRETKIGLGPTGSGLLAKPAAAKKPKK